jgi:hypothetical protein
MGFTQGILQELEAFKDRVQKFIGSPQLSSLAAFGENGLNTKFGCVLGELCIWVFSLAYNV